MKIVAILTETSCLGACLEAAVVAARVDHAAVIEALWVLVDPDRLVAPSEEIQFQRLREQAEGSARDRGRAIHEAFVDWVRNSPDGRPDIEWKSVTGAEEASVIEATRGADLLVLGHGGNMDSGDALHAAIWNTGKPLLLAPPRWRPRSSHFAHIAVALGDTGVAADAIGDAIPWLRAAEQVTALRLGDVDAPVLKQLELLRREGLGVVDVHVASRIDDNRGRQIVREAKTIGADLLVAGAYRHGPFVEWLMGGTTRHMLAAADLPLLLEH